MMMVNTNINHHTTNKHTKNNHTKQTNTTNDNTINGDSKQVRHPGLRPANRLPGALPADLTLRGTARAKPWVVIIIIISSSSSSTIMINIIL